MPAGDGTGPMGMGPMTGRAAGYCAGYPVPGFMNPYGGRWSGGGYPAPAYGVPSATAIPGAYPYQAPFFGRGLGMGWGRGFGRGLGMGWGRGFGRGLSMGWGRGFGRGRGWGWAW
jgi:hypothetical protein